MEEGIGECGDVLGWGVEGLEGVGGRIERSWGWCGFRAVNV